MADLARLSLEDGSTILVEADGAKGDGPVQIGRGDVIKDLPAAFQKVMAPVAELAKEAIVQLRTAAPDEVEIEFGVNLAAKAGAVIAKVDSGCHIKVTAKWQRAQR
jgi:hypothetical protein